MALTESTKLLIQKKILSDIGLEVKVEISDDTGDIVLFRMVKVTRKPMNQNQIELGEAREIEPKAKIGDYVLLPLEENPMIQMIINNCLNEAAEAEEAMRRKQELIASLTNKLKVQGVIEYSLIFAKFVNETMIGDAIFSLQDKYEVRIEKDRRMENDKFEVGKEYPMIILSFEERQNKIIIQASRVTNNFIEELIRMSLVNCVVDVEIKKVYRTPGKLSRVLVRCPNSDLNPSGVVVGPKGSRVRSVESYLNGEKIEIINYAPCVPLQLKEIVGEGNLVDVRYYFENPQFFSGMKSVNKKRAVIVVKDEVVSRVIGKAGVALCLTNKLVGWVTHVMSETDYIEKFNGNFTVYPVEFDWMGAGLGIPYLDNYYGHYLIECGYTSLGECAGITTDNLAKATDLTADDKSYIVDYINSLTFSTTCPNCGAIIPVDSHVCPECGVSFEV